MNTVPCWVTQLEVTIISGEHADGVSLSPPAWRWGVGTAGTLLSDRKNVKCALVFWLSLKSNDPGPEVRCIISIYRDAPDAWKMHFKEHGTLLCSCEVAEVSWVCSPRLSANTLPYSISSFPGEVRTRTLRFFCMLVVKASMGYWTQRGLTPLAQQCGPWCWLMLGFSSQDPAPADGIRVKGRQRLFL